MTGSKVDELMGEKSKMTTVNGSKVDELMGEKSKMITLVSSDDESIDITHETAVLSHPQHDRGLFVTNGVKLHCQIPHPY